MKKISILIFGLSLFALFVPNSVSAQAGGVPGRFTRLLPTTRVSAVTLNVKDTIILTMGDYETLTLNPGPGVTGFEVTHRPVTSGTTSADRWVTEQVDMSTGLWYMINNHNCTTTSARLDDPTPPLRLAVPGPRSSSYHISTALCTGGVREIMLIAY